MGDYHVTERAIDAKIAAAIAANPPGGAASYLVYTAKGTQSSTNPITLALLQNTLGGDVVSARSGVGLYSLTLPTPVLMAKFFMPNGTLWAGPASNTLTLPVTDESGIKGYVVFYVSHNGTHVTDLLIDTLNESFIPAEMNAIISDLPIEIRVYP